MTKIASGLVIDEPWISKILNGQKTWEMRAAPTTRRERFGLIRKGSGLVVGVARVSSCQGPLDLAALKLSQDRHCVPMEEFESGRASKWTTAWKLVDVQRLPQPLPYRHNRGAVTWVRLDPDVQDAIQAQLGVSMGAGAAPASPPELVESTPAAPAELDGRLVPVARDGSWFGPHLQRAGGFTIGEKGDERRVDRFDLALTALHRMAVPRWRRPNAAGNWGLVSGVRWESMSDLEG